MANRFLVGTGVFTNLAIWSASSGGAGGASKPGGADTIIADANSNGFTCTLDEAVSVTALDIQAGTGIIDTSGTDFNFTTSGAFNIAAGNFTANGSTISVGGNLTIANVGSLFTRGTSTVVLTGSANISNPHYQSTFHHFTQNGSLTTTLTGDIRAEGNITLGTGSTIQDDNIGTPRYFRVNGGTLTVNNVVWNDRDSLIIVFQGSASDIPADDYGSCDIWIQHQTTTTMIGNVTTTGQIVVRTTSPDNDVELELGNFNLICGSILLGNTGDTTKGGFITMNGTGDIDCAGEILVAANDGVQLTGIYVGAAGTNTINVAGNWEFRTNATFDAQNSTVTFDGAGAQAITSSTNAFNDVVVNKSGGTATLQDGLACAAFSVTGNSFNDGGFAISASSTVNINTAGTFTATGSLVQTGDANFTYANAGTYSVDTQDIVLQGTGGVSIAKASTYVRNITCAAAGKVTTIASIGAQSGWNNTLTLGTGTLTINVNVSWVSATSLTPIVNAGATINGTARLILRAEHAAPSTVSLPALTIGGTLDLRLQKNAGNAIVTYNLGGTLSVQVVDIFNNNDNAASGIVFTTNNYAITATAFSWGNDTVDGSVVLNMGTSAVSTSAYCTTARNVGAGTANMGTSTWTVTGNWITQSNHTVSVSAWTLNLTGAGTQDITSAGEPFGDIEINSTSTIELQDELTCAVFTMTAGTFDTNSVGNHALNVTDFDQNTGTFLPNGSTVTVTGSCDITGGTFTCATSTFDLTGTGTVANSSTARVFNILKMSAATKTTTLSGNVLTNTLELGTGVWTASGAYKIQFWLPPAGKLLTNAGVTVNATGGTNPSLYFGATGGGLGMTFDAIDMGAGAVTFQGGANAGFTALGAIVTSGTTTLRNDSANTTLDMDTFNLTCGALILGAAASANGATLKCGTGGTTVDCTSFETNGGSTGNMHLNLETCTLQCSGNFKLNHVNHTITPGTSKVIFDGTGAQTITMEGESLYNVDNTNTGGTVSFADKMTITNIYDPTPGSTTAFDETAAHVIKAWELTGTFGNLITLQSESATNAWDVTVTDDATATYVDVTDSNLATGKVDADDGTCVDGGNNSANWDFISTLPATQHHAGGTYLSHLTIGV